MRKLLVQAYGHFGDNLCVAGAISQIKDAEIIIATNNQFKDAVENIPNVKEVKILNDSEAHRFAAANGYTIFQATLEHLQRNVARLDERLCHYFKSIGIDYLQPRSAFFPTEKELEWANNFAIKYNDKPLLGVESGYTSNQSFIDTRSCDLLVNYYKNDYHIVWLCNRAYPSNHNHIITPQDASRRMICALLPKLSLFVSSFSGYFWASRSFEKPPKTICCLFPLYKNWFEHKEDITILEPKEFKEIYDK